MYPPPRCALTKLGTLPPQVIHQRPQSQIVAVGSKATDLPDRYRSYIGMVTKLFPPMDITQVNLYGGQLDSGDRIPNGDTGMGVSTWINQKTIPRTDRRVNVINQRPFVIFLKNFEGDFTESICLLTQTMVDFLQSHTTIGFRFTPTQKIQVRSVKDQKM